MTTPPMKMITRKMFKTLLIYEILKIVYCNNIVLYCRDLVLVYVQLSTFI